MKQIISPPDLSLNSKRRANQTYWRRIVKTIKNIPRECNAYNSYPSCPYIEHQQMTPCWKYRTIVLHISLRQQVQRHEGKKGRLMLSAKNTNSCLNWSYLRRIYNHVHICLLIFCYEFIQRIWTSQLKYD
jgi:hypothetical protein